ncbi:hypothetical protein Q604_UNBC07633G0001, partial [human gut metagenome]
MTKISASPGTYALECLVRARTDEKRQGEPTDRSGSIT